MTDEEINDLQEYIYNLIQNRRNIGQEPTCDDLFAVLGHLEILKESPTPLPSGVDEAAEEWFDDVKYKSDLSCAPINAFKAGAEWMMNNLWHSADGDDLPEIDREVVVLYQRYPLEGNEYAVGFAHRPREFWDGKNIATGEVTRYYPKRYDRGGWNSPNIKWWLDLDLPKKEE